MDFATLVGLMAGVGLVGWGIMSSGELKLYMDASSALIVFGGTLATLLISKPLNEIVGFAKVAKNVFLTKAQDPRKLIADLVSFADQARREGILSLENVCKDLDDDFLVRGLQMAVDGTDPEMIHQVMTNEVEQMIDRHASGKGLLDAIAKFGPAFGMIGTLIGLVAMLANMDDPSKIGPGMAVAILTTLYGALLANLFAIPMADKLSNRSAAELLNKAIIVKGIMSIQAGDNPRIVEQKLKTFLPPRVRETAEA